MPPRPMLPGPTFELRFDEQQQVAAWRKQCCRQAWQDQGQRNEGDVADDQVEAAFRKGGAEVSNAQGTAVDALQAGDGRIGSQLSM